MLQRTIHPNGVVTWQSPLLRDLGVTHAFTTRIGGVSPAPFHELNLGNTAAPAGAAPGTLHDNETNIAENYRRLLAALELPAHTLRAWVSQVHGRMVELIEREPENEYAETLEAEIRDRFSGQLSADALASRVPGVLLTIRTADCVPILLASQDGKTVAAVHAGWRGIVGNVLAKCVRTIHEAGAVAGGEEGAGAPPESLSAAIGPAISVDHFEVGEEVVAEFQKHGLGEVVRQTPGARPHIDLLAAARLQLQHAGVRHIDTNALCTFRDAGDFYSHRRDQGITGRMAAAIAAR